MCCFQHMEEVTVHRRVKEKNPIYGYKALNIDAYNGCLRSAHHQTAWLDGKIKADGKPNKSGDGSGIYAYVNRGSLSTFSGVIVKVGLWGKVVEFRDKIRKDGFMAHNATIVEVWPMRDSMDDYTILKEILPDTVVVHKPKIKQPRVVTITDEARLTPVVNQNPLRSLILNTFR